MKDKKPLTYAEVRTMRKKKKQKKIHFYVSPDFETRCGMHVYVAEYYNGRLTPPLNLTQHSGIVTCKTCLNRLILDAQRSFLRYRKENK